MLADRGLMINEMLEFLSCAARIDTETLSVGGRGGRGRMMLCLESTLPCRLFCRMDGDFRVNTAGVLGVRL